MWWATPPPPAFGWGPCGGLGGGGVRRGPGGGAALGDRSPPPPSLAAAVRLWGHGSADQARAQGAPGGGGGRLQPVLMRPTPQLSFKTWGGGSHTRTRPGRPPRVGGRWGFGTRPWRLALVACGSAYWPLTLEPSAMTRGGGGYIGGGFGADPLGPFGYPPEAVGTAESMGRRDGPRPPAPSNAKGACPPRHWTPPHGPSRHCSPPAALCLPHNDIGHRPLKGRGGGQAQPPREGAGADQPHAVAALPCTPPVPPLHCPAPAGGPGQGGP